MGAVGLENMPKDWLAANFNYSLELEMGFFGDADTNQRRRRGLWL
jgi:hypothetical protein